MFLQRKISLRVILQFAWKVLLVTFLWSSCVYVLYFVFGLKIIGIPFLPVGTIGTAVALYVGFKNNSAYDRLWEARRIWGSITNASRMWAAMVMDCVGSRVDEDPIFIHSKKKELIYRHLAWINMLRLQLRKTPVFSEKSYLSSAQLEIIRNTHGDHNYEQQAEEVLRRFLGAEDRKETEKRANPAAWLLRQQDRTLMDLKNAGWLDEYEYSDMARIVKELFEYQGGSERIKSFPFPRQYANFSVIFVYIFIFLLPLAMVHELGKSAEIASWLAIPICVLIAWVFNVMEQIGDASENPFDMGINDIPLHAICRNIEIELRENLGEHDLPPKIQPVHGILM